jgi:hypothetical protein
MENLMLTKTPVTLLTEKHFAILNDDDNKPWANKIKKEEQGKRFFISWDIRLTKDREALDRAIDWLVDSVSINLQKRSIEPFRSLAAILLLNLAKGMLQRRWMQIPRSKGAYDKGSTPHQLGFSYRHVTAILDLLVEHDVIYEVKGAKYLEDPQLSAYQVTERFDAAIAIETLSSVELPKLSDELVRINKLDSSRGLTDSEQQQLDQDITDLTLINSYLNQHSYPLKGSMSRVYSRSVGLSGRIYCEFQSLARRRVPIRQHSLIDGELAVEVDIVASHPRIAVQEFHNEKLPTTFYQDVADELSIDRHKIKKFFQVALSSGSKSKALRAFTNEGNYDTADFNSIEEWVLKRYPKVPFYKQWSQLAMNHEGEIIKEVMLRGVDCDIPVLPIHDAVAVRLSDKEWAIRTLKEVWNDYFGKDYCEVDVKAEDLDNYLPSI